jgi:hypothetical protein
MRTICEFVGSKFLNGIPDPRLTSERVQIALDWSCQNQKARQSSSFLRVGILFGERHIPWPLIQFAHETDTASEHI